VYLDFRKAFDSVPHDELLYKLWALGITGPLWFWIKSYLSNRTHYTSVLGSSSTCLPVKSGVPQGSVLGPLFFLIYINDLPTAIPLSLPFLFADDTKILKQTSTSTSPIELQSDLNELHSWCSKWNLTLNMDKCTVVHFAMQPKLTNSTYFINNQYLSKSPHQRDLGVMISENLSWSSHYNLISSKAYRALNLIKRSIPYNTPIATKKTLYLVLVRSHLSYCCQIWRPHKRKDIILLERIQRRGTKLILPDLP
jgi:hypothetical protein